MLWLGVGVYENDGEGVVALCFRSLSTASRSVYIMRNCHENKSIEGYEPRILTASPAIILQSSQAPNTIPSLPTIPHNRSPPHQQMNHMFLRFMIGSMPHERHSFIYLRDSRIQKRGKTDGEVEYLGTGLVPHEQEVVESLGD